MATSSFSSVTTMTARSESGRRNAARCWRITASTPLKLARGLADLHSKGLFHRDLCPDTIAVTANGQPVLYTLYYAAKPDESRRVRSIRRLRAPTAYDPPEAEREFYDGRLGDLYSLATIARAVLRGADLPEVLDQCLDPSPLGRPRFAEDIVAGLEGWRPE